MDISAQDIINDANRLSTRLKKYDDTMDGLLTTAQSLEKHVESMKNYHSQLNDLSASLNQNNTRNAGMNGNSGRPQTTRSSLIMTIQRESRQLQALERENRDLRLALEDCHNALELIMSKYRAQVAQLIQMNRLQTMASNPVSSAHSSPVDNKRRNTVIRKTMSNGATPPSKAVHSCPASSSCSLIPATHLQQEKIMEMAAVMMKAVDLDESTTSKDLEVMTQLQVENRGLRELLKIAIKNGDLKASSAEDENQS